MSSSKSRAEESPAPQSLVLSLDGGGVRGLSSLIILQGLLNAAHVEPHKAFDLMCGTSAGGLSAIMLGRLGASIEDSVAEFEAISKKVFEQPRRVPGLRIRVPRLITPKYDERKMIDALTEALAKYKENDEAMMHAHAVINQTRAIPAYVVCVEAEATDGRSGSNLTVCLGTNSSIATRDGDTRGFDSKILHAARATSAAPTYFKAQEISINGSISKLLDGGLNYNNPIETVRWTTRSLNLGSWDENIRYISIGTGHSDKEISQAKNYWCQKKAVSLVHHIPNSPADDLHRYLRSSNKELKDILATGISFSAHIAFKTALRNGDKNSYFRFDCDAVLDDGYTLSATELDAYKDGEKIRCVTQKYLETLKSTKDNDFIKCVEMLEERGNLM